MLTRYLANILLKETLVFVLSLIPGIKAFKRSDVVLIGTTLRPDFTRIEGKGD